MKLKRNQKGFTLIEVVLVLAIGGLIFLLAFLAFQQVSANQRDTKRRSAAGTIISEIQNAAGDRNGTTVFNSQSTLETFVSTYLNGKPVTSGSGSSAVTTTKYTSGNIEYTFAYATTKPAAPASSGVANVSAYNDKKCNAAGNGMDDSKGNYAVLVGLEKGVTCRDDS